MELQAESTRPDAEAGVDSLLIHQSATFRWYHLEDPNSPLLDRLAQQFGFHELEIEDCRHLNHTAKLEPYENHLFIIANTLHFVPESLGVWFGEVDFFVGSDYLVTVHLGPTRSVQAAHERMKAAPRLQRPDRALHAVLDSMVDRYLPVLDEMGDRIEQIEDVIHADPSPKVLEEILSLRRGLSEFRRTVSSMRDMVNAFMHQRAPYYRADMAAYWRDLYDHIIRALTLIETSRDLLTSVLEVYLSSMAQRTNEVMKVLTIWATIFLPLVVITGYFGMNFQHLPLMESPYGVAVVHILMIVLSVGLLIYFRTRRWL